MTAALLQPRTVAEAVALLAEDEDSRPLAGGQSLMVLLRQGLARPSRLVSLHAIPELAGLGAGRELVIGSMLTYRQIAAAAELRQLAALRDACRLVGPIPVQNAGTPGGSLCHNAPGADVPPALLALDAEAVVRSRFAERRVPLTAFFEGYFETALGPGELLTAIAVPVPPSGARSAYLKFNFRLVDMALVGVAVSFRLEAGLARDVRLALGGVAAVPFRARAAEAAMEGTRLDAPVLAEAGRLAAEGRELISDLHCSAAYRRRVIPVIVRRAVEQARHRASP